MMTNLNCSFNPWPTGQAVSVVGCLACRPRVKRDSSMGLIHLGTCELLRPKTENLKPKTLFLQRCRSPIEAHAALQHDHDAIQQESDHTDDEHNRNHAGKRVARTVVKLIPNELPEPFA